MDVRTMFDSEYLGAWDLNGRDVVVVISHAIAGELTGQGGKKSKKPIVFFQGKKKGMALNKTCMKTIANLYGFNTAEWKGKPITLYPTRTTFGGVEVDCIRVRPTAPQRSSGKRAMPVEQPIDPDAEVNVDPEGDIQDQAEDDASHSDVEASEDAGA